MIWYVLNASEVVLKDNEIVEVVGTSCIMYVHASEGIPLSHHEGTDAYIQWQDNDRYVLHSAVVTVTNSNGSRHKSLTNLSLCVVSLVLPAFIWMEFVVVWFENFKDRRRELKKNRADDPVMLLVTISIAYLWGF